MTGNGVSSMRKPRRLPQQGRLVALTPTRHGANAAVFDFRGPGALFLTDGAEMWVTGLDDIIGHFTLRAQQWRTGAVQWSHFG